MTQPPSDALGPVQPGAPIVVQFPNLSKLQAQAQRAPAMLALASDFPVSNAEQLRLANLTLQDLLRVRDALETERKEITGPLHKTKVWIDGQFKPVDTTLEQAIRIMRTKVETYVLEQRRIEQQRFQQAQQAHAAGNHQATALALNAAAQVVTAAPAGTSVREFWEAEVFNPSLVPYEYLCPDVAKIEGHAKATPIHQEPTAIPGVRFVKRAASTVRR